MPAFIITAGLSGESASLPVVVMRRGLGLVVALTLVAPPVRGWLHRGGVRITRTRTRTRTKTRMSSSRSQAIDVEELWPHLAGKQTSANDAAGKVIREAWAKDQATRNGVGDSSSSSSSSSSWNIRRSVVDYKDDGGTALQGLCARPEGEGLPDRLPGVIVAHTAVGPQEDMILWKLDAIAQLGYAAFALDMFGTGAALWNRAQSLAARRPITEDRSLMQARAMAAVRTLGQMEEVDQERLAAVGYCFGGMAVLDLARMAMARPDADGEDDTSALPRLKAVASLHGILAPISPGAGGGCEVVDDTPIGVPRVLVLHATADPFVPPEQVQAMETEFLRREANLEIVRYGAEALHAFTRPEKILKADKDAGLYYCKHADEDSWRRVVELLREELS